MNNIMLDLETMSLAPNAAIVSIGAVEFGAEGLGREFYQTIELASCQDYGLDIDAGTVMFWLDQSRETRVELILATRSLRAALLSFTSFLGGDASGYRVWGNGATFDNVVLKQAYKAVGEKIPWHFTGDRCYRTLKNLLPDVEFPNRVGNLHHALDDAKSQALHCIELLKVMEALK